MLMLVPTYFDLFCFLEQSGKRPNWEGVGRKGFFFIYVCPSLHCPSVFVQLFIWA